MINSLTHYDPRMGVTRLSDMMNRLFAESVVLPRQFEAFFDGNLRLQSNLQEKDDAYSLQIALPGMDPNKLEVHATGRQVTVKGSYEIAMEKGASFRWQGLATGEFEETFTLPLDIDGNKAEASYERGILTLSLPKATTAKSTSIKVKMTA
jgi:HSP20 family protein